MAAGAGRGGESGRRLGPGRAACGFTGRRLEALNGEGNWRLATLSGKGGRRLGR